MICAKPGVLTSLQGTKAAEVSRITSAKIANTNCAEVLQTCNQHYMSGNFNALIEEASRFDILSKDQYSESECVLAEINKSLLLGDANLVQGPASIAPYIAKCCETYNRSANVDNSELLTIETALKVLGGKDTST